MPGQDSSQGTVSAGHSNLAKRFTDGQTDQPTDVLGRTCDAWDVDQDYADHLNRQGGTGRYTSADVKNNPVLRQAAMRNAMNTRMPPKYRISPDENISPWFFNLPADIIVSGEPYSTHSASWEPEGSRITEVGNEGQGEALSRPAKVERKNSPKSAKPIMPSNESSAAMQARLEQEMGVPSGFLGSSSAAKTTKYVLLCWKRVI